MSSTCAAALDRYQRWNSAVYAALFNEPRPQAPAYLYLEPELLAVAAAMVDVPAESARTELATAVRASLGWDKADSPFLWHLEEAWLWAEAGMSETPPFLALLAVLVLAAETMVSDAAHAAHNYYDRLLALLDADDQLSARLRRNFKDTVELWSLLNDWLVQWDGELGLPSAQVTDRRVNVGYPISQALVSAQDRRRLASAFEVYGLRPGRRMAPLEMEQYLSHWLSLAGAPTRLRRLWDNEEARRRISLIACGELEAWSGPAEHAGAENAGTRMPLIWRAELTRGALPALDLFLACQGAAPRVCGRYDIVAPTDKTGREGLAQCGSELAVRPMRGSELCVLEPWDAVSVGALLAGAFTLERREKPAAAVWRSSNPILVLAYDGRDALWHEVSRAQLLERCIVLAHADVLEQVESHIRRYARDGFQRHEMGTLHGLPAGWTAFLDVALADAPEEEASGVLAALSPMRANVLALEGGLRLGQQTWHADAPPQVVATLADERRLRLSVERRRALDKGPASLLLGDHLGRASCALAGAGLASGDYVVGLSVVGSGGARPLDQVSLRLRNASWPRPVRPGAVAKRAYSLAEPGGLISAASEAESEEPILAGCAIENERPARWPDQPPTLPGTLEPALAPPPPPPAATAAHSALLTYEMPCAVLGHHIWVVDRAEPGDNMHTLKHMQCRVCQREEWSRNRGRKPRAAATRIRHSRRTPEPPRARLPEAPTTVLGRPALDLLLDALSYMGSGSWPSFREAAEALNAENPWFAAEAARALCALGHIDLTLEPRSRRIAAWQATPPTLAETCDGSWVLAGARTDRLVQAVLDAPEARAARESGPGTLTVIRLRPGGEDGVLAVAERLEEAGFPLAISERFSERLARQLPPLGTVLENAELFRLGSTAVERLDLASRQWIPADDDRTPGAYRATHHSRLHGVITGDDGPSVMRVTDVLSAKHLAAASGHGGLVAYHPRQQTLSVPIGAELPGILDRVATLCAGAPAVVQRDSWSVHYFNVPPTVAGHIQRSLGL